MFKGCFMYDNVKFKYKFSVIEQYHNDDAYAYSMIQYKYKKFQIPCSIILDPIVYNSIRRLLKKYDNMDEKELMEKLENEIIEDYELKKKKKKWK